MVDIKVPRTAAGVANPAPKLATVVAGMCVGFPHAQGAHTLRNVSGQPATYLEIGDRTPGDMASYPQDDLKATKLESGWAFTHKDGTPYAK